MKALIDKLTVGKIEYDVPEVEMSVAKIEESVVTDSSFCGEFTISSTNKVPVKGLVYSTNTRVRILNEQFHGLTNTIKYEVDTMNIKDGSYIRGEINLVTNCGEISIPVFITVLDYSIVSSIGRIENYFHFANLVHTNYEEALKLFLSKDFCRLLEKNDRRHIALYEGLIKSQDQRLALEEFLIAINKKTPVHVTLDKTQIHYSDVEASFKDTLILERDNWGYLNLKVTVKGDFITECKRRVTHDDFAGNRYEYTYLIDVKKLYQGVNYGCIEFEHMGQTDTYQIVVDNQSVDLEKRRQETQCRIDLLQSYLKFRMHKCDADTWVTESMHTVDLLLESKNKNLYYYGRLYKAQLLLSCNKAESAEEILDDFIRNRLVDADKNVLVYCYYLYVRSLLKREAAYTAQVLEEIQKMYDETRDWQLLWIMLYLDEKYDVNKSLKYTLIKGEYAQGCRSPLMYYEALSVLNEQPGLLRILNTFEQQILYFGAKNDYIDEKLVRQFVELVSVEKRFSETLYKTLTVLYENHPSEELLTAICTLLVRGNKTDHKYFTWYEKGVEQELRITNLYEYYMFSIDANETGLLPKMIYMYFIYNGEVLGEKQEFLYSNIIMNKKKIPEIYANYTKIMEQYLFGQLFEGNMNRKLAVIYKEVIQPSIVNTDVAKKLPDIVETYEISCDEPQMMEVVVIHKETNEEQVVRLVNGKAYVRIYTESPIILFVDQYGRRYANTVKYTLTKLLDMDDYLKLSFELDQENEYLLLHFAERYLLYQDAPIQTVTLYKNIMKFANIRTRYRQEIIADVVEYYFNHLNSDELDEYLRDVDQKGMDSDTRQKITQMRIERRLYKEAYQSIKAYGYEGIPSRILARLCTTLIKDKKENEEEQRSRLLLELASYIFRKGKYNEEILEYLSEYFNGTMQEMLQLWEAEYDFVYENHKLEERILVQAMFIGDVKCDLTKVFLSYYKYGICKNIKLAYYSFCSYHYLYHMGEKEQMEFVLSYMEKDMMRHLEIPTICKIALLEYTSQKDELEEDKREYYKSMIMELSDYNILFDFYKKYKKWFEIPFYLEDKVLIDYRTNPKDKVYISYTVGNGEEESNLLVEPMQSVFPGIFIKDFVLFYGDKLNYYISKEQGEEEKKKEEPAIELKSVCLEDESAFTGESRFELLNKILIAGQQSNEEKERMLMKEYMKKKNSAEAFEIL